jgi:hypothetical protein
MIDPIQHHQNRNTDRTNISLSTCYSRTSIGAALAWSNTAATTIDLDLTLCGCTKEYLRYTGKNIDLLEQWEFDLIGALYQQTTKNIPPVVNLRLEEIGQIVREYTDLNLYLPALTIETSSRI